MATSRPGPGHPRSGKTAAPLQGVVNQPSKPGRVVEATLPCPKDIAKIVSAFAKLGIFSITIEFAEDAMHIYGTASPTVHSAEVPTMLVTVPARAMAQYYCAAAPKIVCVDRTCLTSICGAVSATHQSACIYLYEDMRELSFELSRPGTVSTQKCMVAPATPGRLPHEPRKEDFVCSWRAADLSFVAQIPTSVNEIVTVRCAGDQRGARVEFCMRACTPSASNTSVSVEPAEGEMQGGAQHLCVEYLCTPFLAADTMAKNHSTWFFHGDGAPLIIEGLPSKSAELISSCYFRIEAPACRLTA